MTLQYKTPTARKEALSCCRRCLAVMLCCVLVFGLTVRTAPRARAAGEAAAAVNLMGAVPVNDVPGATVGLLSLIGLCADMETRVNDVFNEENLAKVEAAQRMGYKWGWQIDAYLRGDDVDEASKSEWDRLVEGFKDKGGVAPGDSILLSQHLAETIRQWSLVNFDFMDGALSLEDDFLFGENDAFILTKVDTSELEAYTGTSAQNFLLPLKRSGQSVFWHLGDLSASYTYDYTVVDKIVFTSNFVLDSRCALNFKVNFDRGSLTSYPSSSVGPSMTCGVYPLEKLTAKILEYTSTVPVSLFWCNDRIYACSVSFTNGVVAVNSNTYVTAKNLEKASVTTTFTPTPNLTTPVLKDITMTVPADLPVVNVGEYSVPAIGTLTGEELTGEETGDKNPAVPGTGVTAADIEKAISAALPITGAKVGDQTVDEAMNDPDSLGAVIISKFPFSIPWDVAKAISLLAAPPVTPRWEVDFLAPMSDMVGGWRGNTAIVLDFGEYPIIGTTTRWVSTLMFVYALALGTKKLVWTA